MVFLAGCLLIQLPSFQTKITGYALERLSMHIDGDLQLSKLYLRPFNTLVIKDLTITDKAPFTNARYPEKPPIDTLASFRYVTAQFSLKGLIAQEGIEIDKVKVSDGSFNYVLENNAMNNLSRIFHLHPSDKKPAEKDLFSISDVELENVRFRMLNYKDKKTQSATGSIDWNDLDVRNIHAVARDLSFSHGIMYGTMDRLSAQEKSGFEILNLSAGVKIGKGKAIISDIDFQDGQSDLQLKEYRMEYENGHAFKNYIQDVTMFIDIRDGILDFKTLRAFAPGFKTCTNRWKVKGRAHGTVDSLRIDGIDIDTEGGLFRGHVKGSMTGLPDISKTRLDARISNMTLNTAGLANFINGWSADSDLQLATYAPGVNWRAYGSARGMLNDFKAQLQLGSRIGNATADIRIRDLVSSHRGISLDGLLNTYDLDLGKIIGNNLLGHCTVAADLSTRFGKGQEGLSVQMNSVKVDRLHVNGYDYSDLVALGTLNKQSFNGKIICHDPALNFLFQGTFAFSPKTQNALYSFYLNAGMVDLQKMNIDTRGKSKLQFQTLANFKKTNEGNLTGNIKLSNLVVENKSGKHDIGNIELNSEKKGQGYRIDLNSPFADAEYSGNAPIFHFVNDLLAATLGEELPSLFSAEKQYRDGNRYRLSVNFNDSMDLLSYVMPGLYIADSTRMTASIDPEGIFQMRLTSPRLAWKGNYLRNTELNIGNASGNLSGILTSTEVKAASFLLKENRLNFKAGEDHIGIGYTYNNEGSLTNRGELYALGNLSRTALGNLSIDLDIIPSKIYLNSREWSILPAKVHYADHILKAYDVEFESGEQRIRIDGGLSKEATDTLGVYLERMDISIINPLSGMDLGISGNATGSARLISPMNHPSVLADLICDKTTMSGQPLGTLKAQCKWNDQFKRFDFLCNNLLSGKKNLDISGSYTPSADYLSAKLGLDGLQIAYASTFLKGIFSELGGSISGNLTAEGVPSRLNIKSEGTRLDNGHLKISFTNVGYDLAGRFDMDEYGVYFRDMKLRDRFGATGSLGGKIWYDHFWNMGFDLQLKAHQLESVNLTEKQNEHFYGNVFASGNINFTGPLTDMLLEVDAVTSKAGNLHIPLNSSSTAVGTNLLTFRQPERIIYIDPYEAMMEKAKHQQKRETNFNVKIRATATPDLNAIIEIDKETGNVLSGRGNGMITLDIRPNNDIFDINGDYTIVNGKYHFVAMGLASRDFRIKQGSTVHFNGDIMNTTLDIDAVYRTKASLTTLIDDQNSVGSRRNIDCGIKITDKMLSPRLSFSIDVPDLDPMIKSKVDNALSTEDKVQKQFLSLIISNNFLPDEQSGIVNNSSIIYSNVSEIMSNQLNNIFEKLNIPLDLGLNYQPNDKGTDIFDVALSTQLFNNRVIVNGSVGNKQNKLGSTSNDVVGDLDIEIKLDKSGGWRANLFSHSADAYTNFLDNSQRNGIGLTWQQEFNSFGNYLKTLFMNKENRRKAQLEEENLMIDGSRMNVKITKDNYRQDKKDKLARRKERKARREAKKKERNDRKQRKTISDSLPAGRE